MKPLFGGYVTLHRHEYIMVCDTWDEALKELHWIADQCKNATIKLESDEQVISPTHLS